jgi:hypothetical protein
MKVIAFAERQYDAGLLWCSDETLGFLTVRNTRIKVNCLEQSFPP